MRQTVSWLERFLAGWLILIASSQGFLIGLFARIFGNAVMQRAMRLYLSHPKMQQGAAAVGVPDMLDRADAAIANMKAHAPESVQWQNFIENYGGNPEPDKVADLFAWMLESGALEDQRSELPMAAVIIALGDRHQELQDDWRQEFPELFRLAGAVCLTCEPERSGWNDYYMARWFILRGDDTVRELIRRTERDGEIGATASWMVASVSNRIPEFAKALERGGYQGQQMDSEFDCGDTTVKVGPGPHQITRMPKRGVAIPAVPPSPYGSTEEAERASAAAMALERAYNARLAGATIQRVAVHEDPGTQETAVAIFTSVGPFGFSSTRLNVNIDGLTPGDLEATCNSR